MRPMGQSDDVALCRQPRPLWSPCIYTAKLEYPKALCSADGLWSLLPRSPISVTNWQRIGFADVATEDARSSASDLYRSTESIFCDLKSILERLSPNDEFCQRTPARRSVASTRYATLPITYGYRIPHVERLADMLALPSSNSGAEAIGTLERWLSHSSST